MTFYGVTMINLVGKIVEVETGDMTYTGKLIEVGEDEVQLESVSGWIVVPVEKIVSIKEKND
jgi:hypothetical protein